LADKTFVVSRVIPEENME